MDKIQKISALFLVNLVVSTTGCRETTSKDPAPEKFPPQDPMTSIKAGLDLKTTTEGKEIFSRAFWRHPTDDDRILHAERRQWSDAGQRVRVWQWILAVEPGPELRKYLETNPFRVSPLNLAALPRGEWIADPPVWLPSLDQIRGMHGERSDDGRLMFIHNEAMGILYAFDTGTGFKTPVDSAR